MKKISEKVIYYFSRIQYYILFGVAVFSLLFLIFNTYRISISGKRLSVVSQNYRQAEEDAFFYNTASDYLTAQTHYFVVNNDLQNLLNYFNEINITKRREATFNRIKTNTNEKCSEFIDSMKTHSDNLTKTEFYVFKLVCEAIGIEQNFQPSEITETKLTDEDKKLKKEEQISKAIKIIYGPEYQNEKLQMKNCLKNYYDTLIEDIKSENDSYTKKINTYTMLEHIFVIILFSSLLFFFLASKRLKKIQKILTEKNTRDTLTGVRNRESFDEIRNKFMNKNKNIAFAMIDIDFFKEVNDTYGHNVGDTVLKFTASVISSYFREDDYFFRIGGDEFAMILPDCTQESKDTLIKKFTFINAALSNKESPIPECTLSVGIAFSTIGYTEKLQKCADVALYQSKKAGRNRATVYQPYFE